MKFNSNSLKNNLVVLHKHNVHANKILNSCKSTLRVKQKEEIFDPVNFYDNTHQNQMKDLDKIKELLIKFKNANKQ